MTDHRPANCRFRLQEEGKPYPKSSCTACGRTIVTGLGPRCHREADLIPRADAELAVAEAIRRAADMIEDNVRHAKELGREIWAMPDLRALARAEASDAEVQRLREERDQAVRGRNEWRDDFKALAAAVVGDTGLSAMTVAAQARTFRPRAERAEAERDAALARVEKLRHQITEASDPDFIWGAMDNVNDMDVTLDQFAAAASRAIRAAMEDARHG